MSNITEIVYLLDKSGSMQGLEKDTIGGFNSMIAKQKKTNEKAFVSTVLFDNNFTVLHDRIPIEKIRKMTSKQYFVGGSTALLDAIGFEIKHISNIHKAARKEDIPTKTIFVITTDGMENSSRYYSYETIHNLIKKQREKYGWEFIFIGANIDSEKEAKRFGIREDRALNYIQDDIGTACLFDGVSKAVCNAMKAETSVDMECMLAECKWDEDIRKDYYKRKR